MLFDKLAGIVERHLPQYQKMMGSARLFRIAPREPLSEASKNAIEMPKGYDEESALVQNFGLPFNTIAIEATSDRHSHGDLAVIIDTIDKAKRVYSVLGITKAINEEFKIFYTEIDIFNNLEDGEILVGSDMYTKGINIRKLQMWSGQKDQIKPEAAKIVPWDDRIGSTEYTDTPAYQNGGLDEKLAIIRQVQSNLMGKMVRLNLATVVLYIVAINSPSHFVVEESPADGLRESKKSIKRSCDRPHYIVLTPSEIRTRFISKPTDSGRTVAGHERRAHYRKLTSERYVNARGKIIRVEAVWVGPSEATVNKNRYKVLLDL